MSYHRQIGFPSNYPITPVHETHHSHHSANKENISLHSQIFQRLHAANSQNKPNLYKQLKASQTMNTKKCLSPIKSSVYPLAKAFAQSNGPNPSQHNNSEVKGNRRSNCETPPEMQSAFGAFNEETDVFENRFKSFGEEIQQIKELDETSSTGSNNLDGINNEIILVNGYNPEKRDSEVTKTLQQIQEKIIDVNEQYKQLTQKISEFQSINEEDSETEILNQFKNENQLLKGPVRKNENGSISRQKEEDFLSSSNLGSVRSEHRLGYKLSLKPQNREIRNTSEKEKKKLGRSGHEKSTSYSFKKKELESKAKLQKDFEKKSKELMSLAEELRQREDIVQEKENLFKSNEKAFEKLTQELEDQSEKLAEQKIDFSNKVEMFNLNMQKFQEEREEFAAHVIQKNNELKVENERLQNIRNEIQREQKMLDEKCREILKGYSDYNIKKTLLEKKEEETLRREKSLKEESDHLDAKRLGFFKDRELAEKELKAKEERLIQWEQSLEARKIAYDEYDLKLMSMKLNEEVWQKKRNIEVVSLQEKIKLVKNKENELQKKEEKLNKMMEEIRKCKEDHIKPGFESPKALDPERRE